MTAAALLLSDSRFLLVFLQQRKDAPWTGALKLLARVGYLLEKPPRTDCLLYSGP